MRIKLIATLALVLMSFSVCNGQKIENSDVANGVMCFSTDKEEFGFKENTAYGLDLYSDGVNREYMLRVQTEKNEAHSFPDNSRFLIKLFDDTVITLQAVASEAGELQENRVHAIAVFPVSEKQLNSMMNGIAKVRVEMLSVDKDDNPFVDNQEKDYKKDKIGKVLMKMKDVLDKELNKTLEQQEANKTALKRNDSSDNF